MKVKYLLLCGLAAFAALSGLYAYYYNRWTYLWELEPPHAAYPVARHSDDSLRVVMIGDSWVGMRLDTMNTRLEDRLQRLTSRPVKVQTRGKGGEESRGIYRLMFEEGTHGTMNLLSEGPAYCVVFAGINDASADLGILQFCHHYRLILDFLLSNGICPVVVEIPDVDIWEVNGRKPLKDLAGDYVKSLMTHCGMYRFSEYREALNTMLADEGLADTVVFVPMTCWNGGKTLASGLYLDDKIHLNQAGYEKMDSCIAVAIAAHHGSQ